MHNKPLFWVLMVFSLGFALYYVHWSKSREGDPQIEAAVRQEAESLGASHLGPVTGSYSVGSGASMTGYFQFDGGYANPSGRVFVFWYKADTNTLIDKIRVGSDTKELRTIWSRT